MEPTTIRASSVLFVCMGNICRSPTAEAVFRHTLRQRRPIESIEVDSAGVDAYHVGESPDQRAQRAAKKRGYDLSGIRARDVTVQDFQRFDLILAMDKRVLRILRQTCPPEYADRLGLYMVYAHHFTEDEVPDPYYGSNDGFERVLDMIEDATQGLLERIEKSVG